MKPFAYQQRTVWYFIIYVTDLNYHLRNWS